MINKEMFIGIDFGEKEYTICRLIKDGKTLKLISFIRKEKIKPLTQKQVDNVVKGLEKKYKCEVRYG
ncbi:hypothetical protein M0R04_11030 [Candidatus Dojkabacteria bacterium]|jgi:hypothetical protein|nr:hypothetical protein [Candidatus Dojkabacteria bacterium]